jgi:hypothetical protein
MDWVGRGDLIPKFPSRRNAADDGHVMLPPDDWDEVAVLPVSQSWYYCVYQDSGGLLWAAAWSREDVAGGCWLLREKSPAPG